MDKIQLLRAIVERLEVDFDIIQRAAQTAYEAATDEANVAENKYDTLGLEASYLATGQARRMEEIRQALGLYRQLVIRPYKEDEGIQLGALAQLQTAAGQAHWFFLGPEAAGLKITRVGLVATVITPRSPLGQQLLGKFEDDELQVAQQVYRVLAVY